MDAGRGAPGRERLLGAHVVGQPALEEVEGSQDWASNASGHVLAVGMG